MNSWKNVATLVRYWMKGRFTLTTAVWIAMGEVFAVVFVVFVGGTFLSFSSRFGLGSGLTYLGLSLLFALFLVGLVQSGFNGSGLPVVSPDVDYVFTSPVNPREIFAAKVIMNSFTTVLLSFPPTVALYLRLAESDESSPVGAVLACLVTLVFFVTCLFLSADITLSLNSRVGSQLKLLRNALLVGVAVISLTPLTVMIPGTPQILTTASEILPSGIGAQLSFGLVSGAPLNFDSFIDLAFLGVWFFALLGLGVGLSRRDFYEVVQVYDRSSDHALNDATVRSQLDTAGRSVWTVVRKKEGILMSRTKETRSLVINGLFLAGFMIIYSLSGVFQSSPTSFLFLLFIIGSFGSGNATRWLEKERLWLVKTSPLNLKRYVSEVYRARVTPLLLVLTPVAAGVGAPLIVEEVSNPGSMLAIGLSLPGALEVAALMMAGGMYFAARYGQSSTDDTLTSQGQDLADVRRFLYQTLINLGLVAPLMGLVLASAPLLGFVGESDLALTAVVLGAAGLIYSVVALRLVLASAGRSLERREDL